MIANPRPSRQAIRAAIAGLLPNGDASVHRTARKLGLSARSLQRYLAETGTSHSELVSDVRIKRACHLLAKSNRRICDIATRLGFANASSFSRAFMRQMNMQPRAYRYQQKSGRQCDCANRTPVRKLPARPRAD
ncbi:helix-turn-helix domain-containing protein [Stappia sp. GBMRC 2046]|uniref:Helix-turn-helix domain-containing protein n=1 Tax=Stappia sediminis TaxID=2692190 RepID=A0A7X3LSA7_9HYPH|nr:helix-turn-helix transcriptional regulator [Stappia sediminis]MXN64178.1 helix-turn-helix domain-containing protein [Stappia sediminis]